MRIIIKNVSLIAVSLLIWPAAELLGQETGNARGPIVDSPYEIVSGWLEPFQEDGTLSEEILPYGLRPQTE